MILIEFVNNRNKKYLLISNLKYLLFKSLNNSKKYCNINCHSKNGLLQKRLQLWHPYACIKLWHTGATIFFPRCTLSLTILYSPYSQPQTLKTPNLIDPPPSNCRAILLSKTFPLHGSFSAISQHKCRLVDEEKKGRADEREAQATTGVVAFLVAICWAFEWGSGRSAGGKSTWT